MTSNRDHPDFLQIPKEWLKAMRMERPDWDPLFHAVQRCEIDEVKKVLSGGYDVNTKDRWGRTPLHVAAYTMGSAPIVTLLANQGADVNTPSTMHKSITPLHVAAICGNANVVAILLSRGANVNPIDAHGLTPLHNASAEGHAEVVRLLLSKGADLQKKEEDGATPLYYAAQCGHADVVECLLASGASVSDRDGNGNSCLTMACHNSHASIVVLLLRAGADVHHCDKHGRSPLFWTVSTDVAKLLISAGADVNTKDHWSNSPLHVMSENGNTSMAELLLTNGAIVDAVNTKNRTALHWAMTPQMAEILIKHGADPERRDAVGLRPYDLAKREGRKEVAAALKVRMPKRGWWTLG